MWRDSKAERATEEVAGFGLDTIEEKRRERVRATIEASIEEEWEAALGARRGARVGAQRRGYRHGGRAHVEHQSRSDDVAGAARAPARRGRPAPGMAQPRTAAVSAAH